MTHYNDLRTQLDVEPPTPEQVAAVLRLLATQPDADMLADALGVGQ